jgi:hypothetical protein
VNCSMLTDGFDTGELVGPLTLSCHMRELPLEPGLYAVWVSAMTKDSIGYLIEPHCLGHAMLDGRAENLFAGTTGQGSVRVPYSWSIDRP